ncbi:MAG: ComF family protein [Eubacterium sp.]|nr:ComF family protein [Eubacterium sp.]
MQRTVPASGKNRLLQRISGILYPGRCVLCDSILEKSADMVCRDCRPLVQFIGEPRCCRCGRPLETDTEAYCENCKIHPRLFEKGFAPFVYDGAVKEALMRLKYGHRAENARFFGKAMYVCGKQFLAETAPQAVVPVPIHRERKMRRGYNQAELLAESLADLTGIPVIKDRILRVRGTAPQKELGVRQRRKNLAGAFRIAGTAGRDRIFPARVLIVDDIYTTGSTIDTIAALLLRAGAETVYFTCAAIAAGFSV